MDYIVTHVKVVVKKRATIEDSKWKNTCHYFFTVDGKRIKVCKAAFLATLGIGEKTVVCALKGSTGYGQGNADRRCKQSSGIKKSDETR